MATNPSSKHNDAARVPLAVWPVAQVPAQQQRAGRCDPVSALHPGKDPHPGAQFSFTDLDGHRFQCLMTDSTDDDIAFLEASHRGHARVEHRIRVAKDTGLANFPFHDFCANAGWLELSSSPRTSRRGRGCSAWKASSPPPSRSGCASPSGTPPGASCEPAGG
jgi:hypothetical protein